MVYKFPHVTDFRLPQIWYYLDDGEESNCHLSLIRNKKMFGNIWGRGFCPGCNERIPSHNYVHKCPKLDTCFACRHAFERRDYFHSPTFETKFCDGMMSANSGEPIKCEECNYVCATPHCKTLHDETLCNKVWYCEKCDQYLHKSKTYPTKEKLKKHNCNEKRCKACQKQVRKDQDHLCELKVPKLPVIWPRMAFVNFEDCLQMDPGQGKVKDKTKRTGHFKPHFATLMQEVRDPGIFQFFQFSHDPEFLTDHEKSPNEFLVEEYWGDNDRPRFGKERNTPKDIFESLMRRVPSTLEQDVLIQVLKNNTTLGQFQKSTLVAKNSKDLTHLFRAALELQLDPKIIAKERNLIMVQLKQYSLSILSLESYYPFDIQELNYLFNFYDDPFFFPKDINCFGA